MFLPLSFVIDNDTIGSFSGSKTRKEGSSNGPDVTQLHLFYFINFDLFKIYKLKLNKR